MITLFTDTKKLLPSTDMITVASKINKSFSSRIYSFLAKNSETPIGSGTVHRNVLYRYNNLQKKNSSFSSKYIPAGSWTVSKEVKEPAWYNVQHHPARRHVQLEGVLVLSRPDKEVLFHVLVDESLDQRLLLEEGFQQVTQLAAAVHPRWMSLLNKQQTI